MAMTDVMEDVDYKSRNFNQNEAVDRHPLWMTDSHYVYHLCYDDGGHLVCSKDKNGDAVCSPRYVLMCSEIKADFTSTVFTSAVGTIYSLKKDCVRLLATVEVSSLSAINMDIFKSWYTIYEQEVFRTYNLVSQED